MFSKYYNYICNNLLYIQICTEESIISNFPITQSSAIWRSDSVVKRAINKQTNKQPIYLST
jgi:hypothetical protein